MKILITGATGLIGKEIGKKLVKRGHEITVLTRDPQEARGKLPFPATILRWNSFDEELPSIFFDGVDSVIHLAGESIADGRWTKTRKKIIRDSRVLGTRNIVNAIKQSNKTVKQFISASAIGIYGNGNDWVDETSPNGKDFLAEVCRDWELESLKLKDEGISVVNPRIGIVLSRKGGALEKMIPPFSLGVGGAVGNGSQWMSWIHLEDLTNLFVFLVDNSHLSGAFNAVAPEPVTNKEFSRSLAASFNKKLFIPVPPFVLKAALGEMSSLITDGQKVSSEKIQRAGFKFKYPTAESALNELCSPISMGRKEVFSEIWLPKNCDEVFPFFSDEKNLEKLTPEFLNFKVLNKSTDVITAGTHINYTLKLHWIPMKWRTLIEDWQPGKKFVDRQLIGPYKLWHHTHEFETFAGGTLMRDIVIYELPFGKVGDLVAGSFVKNDVHKIFTYRRKVITEVFR